MSSYLNTSSTGNVQGLDKIDINDIKGKHVLVVEDTFDTGGTMMALLEKLRS